MAGVNKAIIVGRLGKDPDMRYMTDGTAVANMSIATSDEWTDKNSGEKRERTEWHKVVAFRRLGEICGQYLSKGRQVYIEGKIQTREYEDKDGNRRWTTEIVAFQMQMLGSRSDGDRSGGAPPADSYPDYYVQAGASSEKSGGGYDGGDSGYPDDRKSSGPPSGSGGSGGSQDSNGGYPPPSGNDGPEDDDDIPF